MLVSSVTVELNSESEIKFYINQCLQSIEQFMAHIGDMKNTNMKLTLSYLYNNHIRTANVLSMWFC